MTRKIVTKQMLDDWNTSRPKTVNDRRRLINKTIRSLRERKSLAAKEAIAELEKRKKCLTV